MTVLVVATDQTEGFTRIPLPADKQTGLSEPSVIQADKIVTVHRRNLRQRCGSVTPTVVAKGREVTTAHLGVGG